MSNPAANVCLVIDEERNPATENATPWFMPQYVTFTIDGTPIAKGRARSTRTGHHYTPTKTRNAEAAILAAWLEQHGARRPHDGGVAIQIRFTFEPPKSWPKWKRDAAADGQIPHLSKPDLDNLTKLVCDALNGTAWIDDSQIHNSFSRKDYGTKANTRVTLTIFNNNKEENK